jgi:hypothetical protein
MNRHDRRAAAKAQAMAPSYEMVKLGDPRLRNAGVQCAHVDCEAHFHGDMPEGWRWVISYWDTQPTIRKWKRQEWLERPYSDVALCPEHARQLETSFQSFRIRDLLVQPVKGSA